MLAIWLHYLLLPSLVLPCIALQLCCRWGNSLSTKMFVGRDFVLKHIRVKHAEKVDDFKKQVSSLLLLLNTCLTSICQP